jgi:uncharacterized membrane protein
MGGLSALLPVVHRREDLGMETLFAVLHVTAAIFIIGPMAILPMTGLRALREGSASQVTSIARSATLTSWLSLIVALFGFALVSFVDPEDKLTFGTPWLLASIILYSIAVTVSLSLVAPLLSRAAGRLAAGETGRDRSYGRIAASSGIVTLILVSVVVLMVWRP